MNLQQPYAGSDWLKQHPSIKSDKVTEFACLVADILGITYEGLYHITETVFYRKAEWYKPDYLTFRLFRELSTYDRSDLTKLVLFAHFCHVRVAIQPVVVKREYEGHVYDAAALEITFSERKAEGAWHERHPSIEEAIAKFSQYLAPELVETH